MKAVQLQVCKFIRDACLLQCPTREVRSFVVVVRHTVSSFLATNLTVAGNWTRYCTH